MRGVAVIGLIAVGAALAYAATGFVSVAPGEVVVVRHLGQLQRMPLEAGLHWDWPLGLSRRDRVRIDSVRRLELGLAGVAGPLDDPAQGESLTGDLNLVRYQAVLQYRVSDPARFLLSTDEPERLLARLAESCLARGLARRPIDAVLRDGRTELTRDVVESLSREADRRDLGLRVLGLSLTEVRPPMEVQAAFEEAQSARSEASRRIQEAKTYAEAARPAAEAEARSRVDAAHAEASRFVALARSRSQRYLALMAEAGTGSERSWLMSRLYLERVRDLFAGVGRKLVLAPGEPVDLTLLGIGDR